MPRPRPLTVARRLYRDARARRATAEENRFHSRLRVDPQAPELLLSPHWDDAVLDCWGLLAAGGELRVVNVFAGAPAPGRLTVWDETTGASDSAERARERLAEDAVALARAGREPVNLPLLDAQYCARHPGLDEIDLAVSSEVGSASRVHVPAGVGAHVDHLLTRRYGRMLLRGGMPVTLYAELPYCILHGWPPWVDGREPEPNRNVDAFWRSFLEGVPELGPLRSARVERLDDAAAAAKLEAMKCYATQFPCLNYGARTLLTDPEIHRYEVSWELVAQSNSS